MIIGIAGTLGAGKGTVVEYLKEKGFAHYSVSGILKETAIERGMEPSREVYTILGDEFRSIDPAGPVARSYEVYEQDHPQSAIIESIHDVPEAEFMKDKGAILLGVDAPLEVRYTRISSRGSEKDNVSFEEFKKIALHEEEGGGKHNIRKVLEMADHTISNEGSVEELHQKVDEFLEQCQPRSIEKSAWFCIKDRKVLFARSHNNPTVFYLPGGKREEGETDEAALIREIKEETMVDLVPSTIAYAETFSHHAHGKPANVTVVLKGYFADFEGTLTASDEIDELAWLDSTDLDKVYGVGVKVITWLQERDLIN